MSARCLLTHAAAPPLTWHDRFVVDWALPAMGIRQPVAVRGRPVAPSLPKARPRTATTTRPGGCNRGSPAPFRTALAKTATTSLPRT